jgi:hypothetical protein
MTIAVILLAALLAGLNHFTVHPHGVGSGGRRQRGMARLQSAAV